MSINTGTTFSFMSKAKEKLKFIILLSVILFAVFSITPSPAYAVNCPASEPYCDLPPAVAYENVDWQQFKSWPRGKQKEYSRRVAEFERQQAQSNGASLYDSRKVYEETYSDMNDKITTEAAGKECADPRELVNEYMEVCNTCIIFGEVFNALSIMSERIYDSVAPSAASLIVGVLLVWLAIHVLKAVSSVAPIDPGEFWKTAVVQIFTATFAFFALTTATDVYGYLMEPIITGGFGFAKVAISSASSGGGAITACSPQSPYGGGIFTEEMHTSLDCLMQELGKSLSEIRALGSTLMCIAWTTAKGNFSFFPDMSLWISGAVIWLIVIILILATPYYLFDALVRFGIVGAMLPLFIASWAFKITRSFSQKGFTMLLQSVVSFIAVTIIIAIDIQMVVAIFGSDANVITNIINDGSVEEIKEMFDISGFRFLMLIATGFFAFMLLGKATEIAAHFGGAQFSGAAPMVGGMGVNFAKTSSRAGAHLAWNRAAKPAIKATGKVAYNRFSRTGIGQKVNSFGRKFNNWKEGGDFVDPKAGGKQNQLGSTGNKSKSGATPALPKPGGINAAALGNANKGQNAAATGARGSKANNFMAKQTQQPQSKKSSSWDSASKNEQNKNAKKQPMQTQAQPTTKAAQQQTVQPQPQVPQQPQAVPKAPVQGVKNTGGNSRVSSGIAKAGKTVSDVSKTKK